MNDYEYGIMREVEDSFWWYQTLRGAVVREVKEALGGGTERRILDAGCGTGGCWRRCGGRGRGGSCAG